MARENPVPVAAGASLGAVSCGYKRSMAEIRDRARNKVQEAKGKAKEAAGRATGDRDLKAKGKTDRKKGNVKQTGEKAKETFRK